MIKAKYIYTVFIVSLLALASSCLEPFDFDATEVKPGIVIDGVFDNSMGPHIVKISKVNEFGFKAFEGIANAEVIIIDGEQRHRLLETREGIYELQEGITQGVPGKSYKLEVNLADGTAISSPLETMPASFFLDSIDVRFEDDFIFSSSGIEREQLVITVNATTTLPDTEDAIYLKYTMDELYSFPEIYCGGLHIPKTCFIPIESRSQEFAIFSSDLIESNTIEDIRVATKSEILDTEYAGRHYFTVYQHSITRNAYLYWSRLEELLTQEGTVFDKPPASVPGNLTSSNSDVQVLGYFQVSAVDIKRDFFTRSEYNRATGLQPACAQFKPRIDACCQCLVIENSNTVRPSWF